MADVFDFKEKLIRYLRTLPTYIRVNRLKVDVEEFLSLTEINVEETALSDVFRVKDKIKVGSTWEYASGLIHPQSLTSSFVSYVVDPKPNERVLDITAAPGSKTTHMAVFMENKGVVVGNDRKERIELILSNASRLGVFNIYAVYYDAKNFPIKNYFDKALADVPCSALGSHIYAVERYKKEMSKHLSKVQKVIALRAFEALKKGGTLVYSTCTLAEEENEQVVEFLLSKGAKLERFSTPWGKADGYITLYPWDVESEGFFIAKLKKE